MDKILKSLVVIFIVLFILLAGPFIYGGALGKVYTSSLKSTLEYSIQISTNVLLQNATFFVSLPTNMNGTSPILVTMGRGNVTGASIPWTYSLYGLRNDSMLKIWADTIPPPKKGTAEITYSLRVAAQADTVLDNSQPQVKSYVLKPKNNMKEVRCDGATQGQGNPHCYEYQGVVYASYETNPEANVTISLMLTGVNTWKILQDYRNEYSDNLSVTISGPGKGWYIGKGLLTTGIGDINPFLNRE